MNKFTYVLGAVIGCSLALGACSQDKTETAATNPATSNRPALSLSALPTVKTAPVDEGVKFTKKAPTVGMSAQEKTSNDMTLNMQMGKHTMDLAMVETTDRTEEVMEVAGNVPTKVKVTINDNSTTEKGKDGKDKVHKKATAGKTYILTTKDGKVQVLNDKEKPAPKAEADAIAKMYPSFGKADPLFEALPTRGLKRGEKVAELAEAIKAKLAEETEQKMTVDNVSVVFTGKDGDKGNFDVALTFSQADKHQKMTMPLKGKMSVRLSDGWISDLALEGPIDVTPPTAEDTTAKDAKGAKDAKKADTAKKGEEISGKGTMKITSSYSYK